ncbi:BTAD domain-containing putative transcriptional regulator [Nonomuraea endophytica]|uniref:BTAD domain-containing putative transcriptional regulator n=1 Tax=Nonomuraea endophytica TaxID=714136 RepID=UPI0028A9B91F|nr:BTAD domain-containing putative transcriptional regulator [Nonomuraea endophytica]
MARPRRSRPVRPHRLRPGPDKHRAIQPGNRPHQGLTEPHQSARTLAGSTRCSTRCPAGRRSLHPCSADRPLMPSPRDGHGLQYIHHEKLMRVAADAGAAFRPGHFANQGHALLRRHPVRQQRRWAMWESSRPRRLARRPCGCRPPRSDSRQSSGSAGTRRSWPRWRRPAPVIFCERLVALRMRTLATACRRSEALAVFEHVRGRLDEELGVEPGQELCEATRRSRPPRLGR